MEQHNLSNTINDSIPAVMNILTAYGIIQVLAQDLGIKTGKAQRDLIQTLPVQVALFYAASYYVTGNHKHAFIVVVIYLALKYLYSGGKTSNVCFEDV